MKSVVESMLDTSPTAFKLTETNGSIVPFAPVPSSFKTDTFMCVSIYAAPLEKKKKKKLFKCP